MGTKLSPFRLLTQCSDVRPRCVKASAKAVSHPVTRARVAAQLDISCQDLHLSQPHKMTVKVCSCLNNYEFPINTNHARHNGRVLLRIMECGVTDWARLQRFTDPLIECPAFQRLSHAGWGRPRYRKSQLGHLLQPRHLPRIRPYLALAPQRHLIG